jgi:LysM repeat protein
MVAVVAMVGFLVAFLIVLANSGGTGHSSGSQTTPSTTSTTTTKTNTASSKFAHRRTYRIKPGDTLGAIAIKTGVSVATLQDLNPGLDPQGLVAGQKLKLR